MMYTLQSLFEYNDDLAERSVSIAQLLVQVV